jgi:chromate transporter
MQRDGRGVLDVLVAAGRLGVTSFGGPAAHLGYFREEYVARRRWLDDRTYADLVGLSTFLPGPASSEVGAGVGLLRAGLAGAGAAWLGFTLPSAALMIAFAAGVAGPLEGKLDWLAGLLVAAVAVVALAVWQMARLLAWDLTRAAIAGGAAALALTWKHPASQVVAIAACAAVGFAVLRRRPGEAAASTPIAVRRGLAVTCLVLFGVLLALLPTLAATTRSTAIDVADAFYRTGALVFGGGHVVLPLLEAEVVEPGWVSEDTFVAGYGAAQAVPGPLFTFAAYLGYVIAPEPNGVPGAILATVAIFLPGFLLIVGTLPFWGALRRYGPVRAAMVGVGAGVVGLLAAALYDPVWTSGIDGGGDVALALAALALLVVWRVPAWAVVVFCGLVGAALAA